MSGKGHAEDRWVSGGDLVEKEVTGIQTARCPPGPDSGSVVRDQRCPFAELEVFRRLSFPDVPHKQ